MGSTPDGTLYS